MIQKEATLQDKEELVSLTTQQKTVLTLSTGKKVKIGYIKGDTQDKIDSLIVEYEALKKSLKNENDEISDKDINRGNKITRRFYSKCAAAFLINNYFGMRLFWWLKWRLIYYFGGWSGEDYLLVVTEAKKKAAEQEFSLAMVLLMDMTTTWTMMTKKEAEEYRRELDLAREAQLLKNSQH